MLFMVFLGNLLDMEEERILLGSCTGAHLRPILVENLEPEMPTLKLYLPVFECCPGTSPCIF